MTRPIRMEWVLPLRRTSAKPIWKVVSARCDEEAPIVSSGRMKARRAPPSVSYKSHFGYKDAFYEVQYGPVTTADHSILIVEPAEGMQTDINRWGECIVAIDGFVHGWIVDREYDYWQNATDPLEYMTRGRSYAHLPMKSNDLPYPLEQMIIDISQNPGRRVMRVGYVEAVGYVMWFGEPFWRITGTSKQKVISQDWLKCEDRPGGILRVQAAEQPFTSAEGEQGEIQRRLRQLLFPHVE